MPFCAYSCIYIYYSDVNTVYSLYTLHTPPPLIICNVSHCTLPTIFPEIFIGCFRPIISYLLPKLSNLFFTPVISNLHSNPHLFWSLSSLHGQISIFSTIQMILIQCIPYTCSCCHVFKGYMTEGVRLPPPVRNGLHVYIFLLSRSTNLYGPVRKVMHYSSGRTFSMHLCTVRRLLYPLARTCQMSKYAFRSPALKRRYTALLFELAEDGRTKPFIIQ